MNPQEKQLNALIRLLDDPDQEVYGQVHEALLSFGPSAVAVLEASLREHNFESRFDTRVSHIIDEIQTEGIKEELLKWTQSDDKDLLSGVVIVSKHHDPNIDISYLKDTLQMIKRDIWLELNDYQTSFEQIKIFNRIFFDVHQFKCINKASYAPSDLNICEVLKNREGNSLIISILYSVIAQELEIPVYGVNLPNHFIMAFMDNNLSNFVINQQNEYGVLFYINPMSNGAIFDAKEISEFLTKRQLEEERTHFEPCSNTAIIKRMIAESMLSFQQVGNRRKVFDLTRLRDALLK